MDTSNESSRLCVVGAGLAGSAVTYRLRNEPVEVTLLEKSRGVGGRAATRRRDGCRYDHGANYIKDSDDRTTPLLESLGSDGLVDIDEPVWTFDATDKINESDRQESHKWTWKAGITQFGKRLLAETEAVVRKSTRAEALAYDDSASHWTLTDTDGDDHGPFDAVVLTPPAPQTAELLSATRIPGGSEAVEAAADAVGAVPYRTIRSIMLHYPFDLDRPYYALVNPDREHEIGWLARESCKPGHVPDGEELLIVQMAPGWSTTHYDEPLDSVATDVAAMVGDLLGDDRLADPDWVDDQGWRYALPDAAVDADALSSLAQYDLHVAGDWVVGEGRAHEAFWNGVELGERLTDTPATR